VNVTGFEATRLYNLLSEVILGEALIGASSDIKSRLLINYHWLSRLTLTASTSLTAVIATAFAATLSTVATSATTSTFTVTTLLISEVGWLPIVVLTEGLIAETSTATAVITVTAASTTITSVATIAITTTTTTTALATITTVSAVSTISSTATSTVTTIEIWLSYFILNLFFIELRTLLASRSHCSLEGWDNGQSVIEQEGDDLLSLLIA
jgi:hypothetical protein